MVVGAPDPPPLVISPTLVPAPGGGECITFTYQPPPANNGALGVLTEYYPICPPVASGPPVAGAPAPAPTLPVTVAVEAWQQVTPPAPSIAVPPGWAMCGMPAYLVTKGPLTMSFSQDTPLGKLVISARATYNVDWGDDATDHNTYDVPGEAWPNGTVTHLYVYATAPGHPDQVVVTYDWSGTWSLGGRTGTLPPIQATSQLSLVVRQLQVVINQQS